MSQEQTTEQTERGSVEHVDAWCPSGVYAFWDHPGEDVYTPEDGEAV